MFIQGRCIVAVSSEASAAPTYNYTEQVAAAAAATHGVQPSSALRSNPGKNPQLHTSPPLAAGPPARTLNISQIYWYEIIDSASAPSTYLHISTLPPPSHRGQGRACLVLACFILKALNISG